MYAIRSYYVQRGVLLSAERETVEAEDVYDDFFRDADPTRVSAAAGDDPKAETIEDMERFMIP